MDACLDHPSVLVASFGSTAFEVVSTTEQVMEESEIVVQIKKRPNRMGVTDSITSSPRYGDGIDWGWFDSPGRS